jgi:chemotaxis protein MotB
LFKILSTALSILQQQVLSAWRKTMARIPLIVLSALLVAAVTFNIVMYRHLRSTEDMLQMNKEKLFGLNAKVMELNDENSILKEQVDNQTGRSRRADENLKKLQAEFDAKEKERKSLEAELSSRDTMIAEFQKREKTAQDRILSLQDEIAKGKEELDTAKGQISQLVEAHQRKDRSFSQLEEQLNKLREELEAEKKAGQASIAELKARDALVSQLKERNTDYNNTISSLQHETAKGKEDLEAIRQRATQMEKTMEEKDRSVSRLGENLRQVQSSLSAAEEAREALQTDLASKNAKLSELQKRLKNAQSQILLLENAIAEGKTQTEDFKRKLSELKQEKSTVQGQLGEMKSTYETMITDLKKQIESKEVTIQRFEERISVTFVEQVLFDFGKGSLNQEGEKLLDKVGATLKNVKNRKIRVVGHTDNIPISPEFRYKYPSNWELSAARAAAVVRYFQKEVGLDPANLEVVGLSYYHPVVNEDSAAGRAQNRRVEIIIAPVFE